MKIQHLAVIFIIIIMPIIIVFSEYTNTQMGIIKTEIEYDQKLLNATYDTIKAFQLNTMRTSLYSPEIRIDNIDSAVNVFYNSLSTAFNFDGTSANTMKEYIPAVVFTMYDGYYIYSPYTNKLTDVDLNKVDDEYKNGDSDGKIINGLKPYIYYSCRYKKDNSDFIITYSLDNYIQIEGIVKGNYWTSKEHSGYLIDGIEKKGNTYVYDNIIFKENITENLSEYLLDDDAKTRKYYYTVIDGTKYYLQQNFQDGKGRIFYYDQKGVRQTQVAEKSDKNNYDKYVDLIEKNNSAFKYYKEAYEFTKNVKENIGWLTTNDIYIESPNYDTGIFQKDGKIFDESNIQDSDSNFNRHRMQVIRSVITSNLSNAITGFKQYTKSFETFLMPKISETDWELLENHICIATFMQGLRIQGELYNNYCVVPNNLNKEYVDENDIYLLLKDTYDSSSDGTYTRANDQSLTNNTLKDSLGYQPGVLRINLEKRIVADSGKYYLPHRFLQSYSNLPGSSKLNSIETSDMYKYMRGVTQTKVKQAYYTALGRERYCAYKANKEIKKDEIPLNNQFIDHYTNEE